MINEEEGLLQTGKEGLRLRIVLKVDWKFTSKYIRYASKKT